jgi:hypothetical protein
MGRGGWKVVGEGDGDDREWDGLYFENERLDFGDVRALEERWMEFGRVESCGLEILELGSTRLGTEGLET